MFRQFHPRFFEPALAGVCQGVYQGNGFFASEGFGRGMFPGGGRRHEGRTRRGDIKFILLTLLSEGPRHGYDLIKELEARFGGFRRLSPGSVYPTLQLLEDGGYLTSEQIDGKRVYTVTDSGRQLLSDRHRQDSENPVDSGNFMPGKPPELVELRNALTELNTAVTHIAQTNNLEHARLVRELLVQVKRDIYKMLSE